MKTVNIKGKNYVEVNERLKYFRANFKGYCLISEIVELTDERIVIKAKILSPDLIEVANGLAYELSGSSFINKTSYIENCETSAWGRCLANFGIGLDNSVASADEVNQAIEMQELEKEALLRISQAKSIDDLKNISIKYKAVLHLTKSKLTEKKNELLK
tara:strand:+ start:742 stop:1218 length:477 start_codon:yes stop_codon:yes gene_type:complete